MSEPSLPPPQIALRIPGAWSHPGELLERMPVGFRLTPESLILPDGTSLEFNPMPPDDQFAGIFRSSCRRPPQEDERAIVSRYTVNIGIAGPGGSLGAARTVMQAGAAIVRAGGAGVFIDNSLISHGGRDWISMTEDGSSDAVSFAFAAIVSGRDSLYTLGMHTVGRPDLEIRTRAGDDRGESFIEIVRYVCGSERQIDVGHVFADESGPLFQVVSRTSDDYPPEGPVHNPYGRLRITSMKDIATTN